jgi:hypothetical protein
MSMLPRRLAVGAFVAVTATVVSPLVGTAQAVTFSGAITASPAPDTNGWVQANRPSFVATYTGTLAPSSTITVKQGGTTVACSPVVSGATVSCVPSADLISGDTYDVTSHGVQASDSAAADAPAASFKVAFPTVASINPAVDGSIADGTEAFTAKFTDPDHSGEIFPDSTKSTWTLYDFINGQRGNEVPGAVTFSKSDPTPAPLGSPTDTMTKAHPALAPGLYEMVLHADGVDDNSADNPGAHANLDYLFWVTNAAPANLTSPAIANNQNSTAVPFTGTAAPGLTITVTATDSSAGPTTVSGTVVVPSCANAPDCPWAKTLNFSGLAQGTVTWTAQGGDPAGKNTPSASGPSIRFDTTAPPAPSVTATLAVGSTTLHVSATETATDVANFTVTVSDVGNVHQVGPFTYPATNNTSLPTQSIDVSSLDDGNLTVSVKATDTAGNVGAAASPTVKKVIGVKPDFANSFLTILSDPVSFPTAESHAVRPPQSLTVFFTEPIKQSWHEAPSSPVANDGAVHSPPSSICVKDVNNFCINGPSVVSSDGNSMTTTFSSQQPLTDGSYSVSVVAWPKNWCKDLQYNAVTPDTQNAECVAYNDAVKDTNNQPFSFAVDGSKPVGTTVSLPSKIDATGLTTVGITGQAEPGSTVMVTVNSSGGGTLIANPGGTPVPAGEDGTWSMVSNFAGLSDGTLSVKAVATDAAGNDSAPAVPDTAPVLAARPSAPGSLSLSSSPTSVTLHWLTPAGNGGSPITGYVLTYKDTTANTPAVTATPAPGAAATTATVNGLTTGHAYLFTLCATNAVTDGTDGKCHQATATVTPAFTTALTAKVSKGLVVYGNPITLSGRLTRVDIGAGLASKALTVTPKFDSGALGSSIHVTTDSLGNWTLTISKPAKDALYLAAFNANGADPAYKPANSSVRSLVQVSLRIDKVAAKSAFHTSPVTVSGHITPGQAGRYVNIYAKAAGSTRYQRIGSVKISPSSTWSFTKTFGKGKYYLYANFVSQNGNVGGNSQGVTITRT